jgi:hypothetical protein
MTLVSRYFRIGNENSLCKCALTGGGYHGS